jgi:hypothetical protein
MTVDAFLIVVDRAQWSVSRASRTCPMKGMDAERASKRSDRHVRHEFVAVEDKETYDADCDGIQLDRADGFAVVLLDGRRNVPLMSNGRRHDEDEASFVRLFDKSVSTVIHSL